MLLKKPMVVAYKMAFLSYKILSRLVKTPFISLPNLLARKMLVPELLQDKATPQSLGNAVMHYFENPDETEKLVNYFQEIHGELKRNASERAAQAIAKLIRQ
jgi:lipid-A-disaccharide synthase